MECLVEREELVVEVMAQLVDQRAQEGFECDDLRSLRCAHPYRNARRHPALLGFVQAMEFTVPIGGSPREYVHPKAGNVVAGGQRVAQFLTACLHGCPIIATERSLDIR